VKVADIMSPQVATCSPEDSLSHAAELMWNRDCGSIIVVDGSRRPVGVLTDRDVCMATWSQERSPREIPVHAAMATSVVTCTHGQDVASVHTTLRQHQLHRLPVVDTAGALVGVVALGDLVQDAVGTTGTPRSTQALEILDTVGAITRPRAAAGAEERTSVLPAAAPSRASATASSPTAAVNAPKAAPAKATAAAGSPAASSGAANKPATAAKAPSKKAAPKTTSAPKSPAQKAPAKSAPKKSSKKSR